MRQVRFALHMPCIEWGVRLSQNLTCTYETSILITVPGNGYSVIVLKLIPQIVRITMNAEFDLCRLGQNID